MSMSKCQICGQSLLCDNVYSDPSQHFCISLDGPGITQAVIVEKADSDCSPGTPESQDEVHSMAMHAVSHTTANPVNIHNPNDLQEIGRLHMENAALKSTMPNVAVSVPAGEHVVREVPLASGESVLVDVTVLAK